MTSRIVAAIGMLALAAACRQSPQAAPSPPPDRETRGTTGQIEPPSSPGPVSVDFQNVALHVADGVVMEVRHLQGALISERRGAPPNFDDVHSYSLRIDAGEVAMSPASLTRLLNTRVFNGHGSSITDVEVSIEGGHVKQKGTLHKGVAIPFTIEAELHATPDGRIELKPTKVKAAGIKTDGFMKLLHVELDDLVKSNPQRGFETQGNDAFLDPQRLLPAPRVSGRVTSVRVEGDRIVQIFGKPPAGRERGVSGNYMHYRGNMLQFGRLTMRNTDMRLVDEDPRDPFDFSPTDYVKQLVAGYSKNNADGSLRVFMPDYNDALAKSDIATRK